VVFSWPNPPNELSPQHFTRPSLNNAHTKSKPASICITFDDVNAAVCNVAATFLWDVGELAEAASGRVAAKMRSPPTTAAKRRRTTVDHEPRTIFMEVEIIATDISVNNLKKYSEFVQTKRWSII
jgi:hypothetical protein